MKTAFAILLLVFAQGGTAFASVDEFSINATLIEVVDVQATRKGILNPENILQRRNFGNETALVSEAQWRGLNLRTRLADKLYRHDGGWRNAGELDIQELSYEFDFASDYRLSIGKLSESWHVAYAFHPLGFFEPEINRDDLSQRFMKAQGLPSIVAGYGAEKWDIAFVYSNDFENERDGFNKGLRQWGGRLGMLSENGLETSVIIHKPEQQKMGFGGSAIQVFGNALEMHGSFFMRKGTRRPVHTSVNDDSLAFYTKDPYQEYRRDDGKWYPRGVLGLQWTSNNLINSVIEWSHDERGLDNKQWQHWKRLVRFHANTTGVSSAAVTGNLKYDASTLLTSGARQDYIFLRLTKGGWDWAPEASVLVGVADGSAIWNARLAYTAATAWDADIYARISTGNGGGEFAIGPDKGAVGFSLRYHF